MSHWKTPIHIVLLSILEIQTMHIVGLLVMDCGKLIGQTWNRIGKDGIACNDITSVSSHLDNENKMFVGTEPTTLYRSNDRGISWQKMSALNKLKSSTSWSFPPRPPK